MAIRAHLLSQITDQLLFSPPVALALLSFCTLSLESVASSFVPFGAGRPTWHYHYGLMVDVRWSLSRERVLVITADSDRETSDEREGEVISMGTTEMERQKRRANDRWTVREVIGDKMKIQW